MPTSGIDSPYARSLIAGAIAGTAVDLSLYPIDTLKTRLQSVAGFTRSGGFRGIYKGVGSALVGSAPGAALFFVTYESTKAFLRDARLANQHLAADSATYPWLPGKWPQPIEHMAAASLGEVAACAVRVPTEVVKQRAQAGQFDSSIAALRNIASQRAKIGYTGVWREMYRGWTVTILREIPFTVIQFPLWEAMKQWRRRTSGKDSIAAVESALFGSLAGATAAGITTPLDVLKTRMMLSRDKPAMLPLLAQILRDSGPSAFFAGIGPRILWISAGGALFLGSYQWAFNALEGIK
ncbi:MAG: S-adenosylmethionine transporter [Trizodia sp. TS-e1964]|nr:MAG: S-adenosylmethionine transporter [Trizodia sp. TS-e1964]